MKRRGAILVMVLILVTLAGMVAAGMLFRMRSAVAAAAAVNNGEQAYAAAMSGVDAVLFTGGIGASSPDVREAVLTGLEFMGIEFDSERNREVTKGEGEISTDTSRVRVLVVPTNEEKTIARDVIRVLNGIMPEFTPPETIT